MTIINEQTIENAAVAAAVAIAPTAKAQTALSATCPQGALKQALAVVGHAVPGKASLPVLSNILFRATGGRIELQATDMETAITVWVAATVAAAGTTTLPAKMVTEFVGTLSDDPVALVLDPKTETTRISCGQSDANIKGIDAEEWPAVPEDGTTTVFAGLTSATLRQAIKQVVFAAGDESSTKPIYQGVLIRVAPAKPIELFATDGFRFAMKSVALEEAVAQSVTTGHDLILPAKALVALERALSVVDDATAVRVTTTQNGGQAVFTTESVRVVCRLMAGPHVPFERVMAIFKGVQTTAVLDHAEFVRLTKQAQIFSAQAGYITKFTFQPVTAEVGTVTLASNAPEAGDNQAVLNGQITGAAGEFAASSRFVLDALNVLPKDGKVAFDIVSAQAPAMLRLAGDASVRFIVMPMSIVS